MPESGRNCLQASAHGSVSTGQSGSPSPAHHQGEGVDAISLEGAGNPMARGRMEDVQPSYVEGLSKYWRPYCGPCSHPHPGEDKPAPCSEQPQPGEGARQPSLLSGGSWDQLQPFMLLRPFILHFLGSALRCGDHRLLGYYLQAWHPGFSPDCQILLLWVLLMYLLSSYQIHCSSVTRATGQAAAVPVLLALWPCFLGELPLLHRAAQAMCAE